VGVSPNAAIGVAAVLLYARVDPPSAAGTVTFTDGTAPIPGCAARPVNAASAAFGYATCITTYPAGSEGHHTITATFTGDTTTTSSVGSADLTVTPTPSYFQTLLGDFLAFAHNFHLLGL